MCIQLLRERLSEKVHVTISKGIVGGFEFTVLQRNLKEWPCVCDCQKKAIKVGSKATMSGTVSRAHFFPTTYLEIAVCILQTYFVTLSVCESNVYIIISAKAIDELKYHPQGASKGSL